MKSKIIANCNRFNNLINLKDNEINCYKKEKRFKIGYLSYHII